MTPQDEIAKLARAYAEETVKAVTDLSNRLRNEAIDILTADMEEKLSWLLRTHCIVSKDKATELCRLALEHEDSVDYGLIDGLTDIVCDIFSEQYRQAAEGLDNPEIAKEAEL